MAEARTESSEALATSFAWAGSPFVVISYDLLPASIAERLTPAECEVLLATLEGLPARGIATRRGTRLRTVHNQLARIYAKLGVSSRAELLARCDVAATEG